jgi:hypothetical protein
VAVAPVVGIVDVAALLTRRRKKALAIICLSIRDEIIPFISSLSDPYICWTTLANLYENRSVGRKLLLKNKLQMIRMSEEESVSTYLNRVQEIINQLAAVGEHVPEDQLVLQENLTRSLAYWSVVLSFADVSSLMLQEELFMEMKGNKKAATEGLFAFIDCTTVRPPLIPCQGAFSHNRPNRGRGRPNSYLPR